MSHQGQEQGSSSHHAAVDSEEFVKPADGGAVRISAVAMNIKWGNDERYWRRVNLPNDELGFNAGFELIQVGWLEVKGTLDLAKNKLDRSKTYEICYVVKFNVDAFGWNKEPITFEVITPNGEKIKRSESLEPYRQKVNQWHHIQCGEFSVPESNAGKVGFSMCQVETKCWKASLVLDGVIIKPKQV